MSEISLYPNPSEGIFQIDGVNMIDQEVQITERDLYGSIVTQISNGNQIDLTNNSNGVYFVTLDFNGIQTVTKKIILVR